MRVGPSMLAFHKLPDVKKQINTKNMKKGTITIQMNDIKVEKDKKAKDVKEKKPRKPRKKQEYFSHDDMLEAYLHTHKITNLDNPKDKAGFEEFKSTFVQPKNVKPRKPKKKE